MKKNSTLIITITAIISVMFGWTIAWSASKGLLIALNNFGYNQQYISKKTLTANTESFNKSEENIQPFNASTPVKQQTSSSIKVIIGGDVMFDRSIRLLGQKFGYDSLLSSVTPLFHEADLAVVNLEGTITSSKSKTLLANAITSQDLTFTFATSTASTLAKAGISMVSLANNHADNFGKYGYEETRRWLDDFGIQSFGNPWNTGESTLGTETPLESTFEKNGIKISMVGYHAFQNGFANILSKVSELSSQGNFVIVMPHWGVEYSEHPTAQMKKQAQELVAAGASAIIGSHPHVIENHEMIGKVPVFYSLGNLLFDQYFSPQVTKGNIVELDINNDSGNTHLNGIKIYETSTASKRGVTLNPDPKVIEI